MASRLAPTTPNKAALKKMQGQLKNAVSTYGTLILSWQSDICEIIKLVQYYKGLAIKSESIQKSIDGKSHFVTSLPDNERVGRQLLSSVRLDMEGTLMQTKTFEKRLKDTMVAMIVTYEDAMKSVNYESFELFESGAIFTADHVLDMQQLHKGFALELDRKLDLTRCLYASGNASGTSLSTSSNPAQKASFAADLADISKVLQEYDDTSTLSYIDSEQVNMFLMKNNIGNE